MALDQNEKKELLKRTISSPEGWINLAKAIKAALNPSYAEEECKRLLREVAGDGSIKLPATELQTEAATTLETSVADLLVWQLNKYLSEV